MSTEKELKYCSGCKKMAEIEDNFKNCNACRERGKANRLKQKESHEPCNFEGCKYKRNKSEEFPDYCGKHQTYGWKVSEEEKGNKVCSNYIRGCKNIISNGYSNCQDCRLIQNEKDRRRRH